MIVSARPRVVANTVTVGVPVGASVRSMRSAIAATCDGARVSAAAFPIVPVSQPATSTNGASRRAVPVHDMAPIFSEVPDRHDPQTHGHRQTLWYRASAIEYSANAMKPSATAPSSTGPSEAWASF